MYNIPYKNISLRRLSGWIRIVQLQGTQDARSVQRARCSSSFNLGGWWPSLTSLFTFVFTHSLPHSSGVSYFCIACVAKTWLYLSGQASFRHLPEGSEAPWMERVGRSLTYTARLYSIIQPYFRIVESECNPVVRRSSCGVRDWVLYGEFYYQVYTGWFNRKTRGAGFASIDTAPWQCFQAHSWLWET